MASTSPKNEKLQPLIDFVDHTDQLAEQTLESVDWKQVEKMMPRILKGKSRDDIKQLLLAELDGMSKKRIIAVLSGNDFEESSSSEDEEEEMEIEEQKEIEENVGNELESVEVGKIVSGEDEDVTQASESDISEDGEIKSDDGKREEKKEEVDEKPEEVENVEKEEEEDEEERVNREIQEEVDSFFD